MAIQIRQARQRKIGGPGALLVALLLMYNTYNRDVWFLMNLS